eukprot:2336069-Rhodomonas_salina.2
MDLVLAGSTEMQSAEMTWQRKSVLSKEGENLTDVLDVLFDSVGVHQDVINERDCEALTRAKSLGHHQLER